MKNFRAVFIIWLTAAATVFSQNAWINEFHYDNASTDEGEFIEIVIAGAENYTLSDFSVVLYNGNGGTVYDTKTLDNFTQGVASNGYTFFYYAYPVNGIQNGPDAIALAYQNTLLSGQFLSYEGSFAGSGGPADGITSLDIGVLESSATPIGESLQLSGVGGAYADFIWTAPATHTMGNLNTGQTITGGSVDNPPFISGIVNTPRIPEADEDLTITATITDDNGLTVTDLYYTINEGDVQTAAMSRMTDTDTFAVTLDASVYSGGDYFEYWIHAEDDADSAQTRESDHSGFLIGTMDIMGLHTLIIDGHLLHDGMKVKIRGIATVSNGTFSATHMDVYLQDSTGGINLFAFDAVDVPFTLGNDYTVYGTVDQYNGKAEVIPADPANDIIFNGTGTVPEPVVRTITQLLYIDLYERYEGRLVKILAANKTDGIWGSNQNIPIIDENGAGATLNMYIDGDTDIDESLEGTYPLDITGIFSQFDATPPYDVGYQIIPRSVADLTWGATVIADAAPAGMITEFSLYPNFPNPFNPSTTLQFDVPEYTDNLELSIYNIAGEKVRSLYTGSMKKGRFTLKWDGTDDTHRLLPSGVYFALLRAAAFSQSIKMMLIK